MALEQLASVPVVHAVAKAVFPLLAGSADAFLCPDPVAEILETLLPDLEKVVIVDISL